MNNLKVLKLHDNIIRPIRLAKPLKDLKLQGYIIRQIKPFKVTKLHNYLIKLFFLHLI